LTGIRFGDIFPDQAFGFLFSDGGGSGSMAAKERQLEKSEASVTAILDAGLALFSTQGYGATTLRQIAERAGLSVGNIYHHFPDKHAIYQRLIEIYWERLVDPKLKLNQVFARANFPEDLEELAEAIEEVVDENGPHILLIYLDVIEFQGEHIRAFYEGMASRFAAAYGPRFAERAKSGDFGDADPMIAVMLASRWFFYFFTVEKCFGAPLHFGMTPKQAIGEFIRLLRFGLLPRSGGESRPSPTRSRAGNPPAVPAKTSRSTRSKRGKS
jgi:AcrR family transcriptional regulator